MAAFSPEIDIKDSLILIVDDIPRNIQLLGNILSKDGFKVAVANHGKQALTIIDKRQPDLILLDVMMPELNGYQVCERVKSSEATADIPIIFLTAKNDVEDKLRGFAVGGADFVTKPFEPAEVIARVHTQLRLKKMSDLLKLHNTQLEEMLENRTQALIRSERHSAFSLMIQGIIHNLKNPLNLIYAGCQFIEMEKPQINMIMQRLPERQAEPLNQRLEYIWKSAVMIDKGSKQLLEMVDSMMAKSRSDQQENLNKIDLNVLVQQEYEFLLSDPDFRHGIGRKLEVCSSYLPVCIVPAEIAQVLQNLIRNSLDALRGRPQPNISVKTGKSENTAWIEVEDNGTGIPADYLSKVFEPFFTTKPAAGKAREGEPSGTGLGLHICKAMVEAHHGKIKITSKLNIGTCIRVELPLVVTEMGEKVEYHPEKVTSL
ncbi:MAG: hybrid sensor histidine kinase/response regulator [Calditrichia bacterium]